MNELMHIGNSDISIKEYKGQRVVTFKDIDMVHGRPEGTARKRFADNRQHFVENEDYFIVKPTDLEKIQLSEKRTLENSVQSNFGTALITEQGYLMLVKSFTDDLAWDVQRQLVNSYFKVRNIANEELSPELQMLQGLLSQMVQKELADKERDRQIENAKQIAQRAVETTENIKEAVKPVIDNWRQEINAKFNRIQRCVDIPFSALRNEMYSVLEQRAGCNLSTRVRNMQSRMQERGYSKTKIDKITKMDVIEEDKKLKEVFGKIVSEYEIKYCA